MNDDIVDLLRSCGEGCVCNALHSAACSCGEKWPEHLVAAAAAEIERLRYENVELTRLFYRASENDEHQLAELATMHDLCLLLGALVDTCDPALVMSTVATAWPWSKVLPAHDQRELAAEVSRAVGMPELLGAHSPLLDTINDWRRTASAWTDGLTPTEPFEIGGDLTVEHPARVLVESPDAIDEPNEALRLARAAARARRNPHIRK